MSRHIVRRTVLAAACLTAATGVLVGPSGAAASPVGRAQESGGQMWVSVATGEAHTCGIQVDGGLWCWGSNNLGQLGLGDTVRRPSPTRVGSDTDWTPASSGNGHTCGIRAKHTLWCWGDNGYGQLGVGGGAARWVPTQVAGRWASVSAGKFYTCGVQRDHSLWCWGSNKQGRSGLGGSHGNFPVPTQVGTDTDWDAVSASTVHTCGLRTDHTLWCWGENGAGELGLGDRTTRHTPVEVGAGTDWAQVSLGDAFSCATRDDGTLWCWGYNGSGQLGLGDRLNRQVPVQVGADADWAQVSAISSNGHACATRSDHTAWCWGSNKHGQLGLGDSHAIFDVPTQVGTGTEWSRVMVGNAYTCATGVPNTLYCWGYNTLGQLGLGDYKTRRVPTQV